MQMRGAEPGGRRGGGDAFQDGGSSSHFPAKSGLQADTRALDRDSCMPPMPSTRACSGTQVSGALRQRHGGVECRCRVRGGSVHLASSSSVAWFLGDQDTPCTPTLGSTKRSAESQEGRPPFETALQARGATQTLETHPTRRQVRRTFSPRQYY